jgi:hypothetical protein
VNLDPLTGLPRSSVSGVGSPWADDVLWGGGGVDGVCCESGDQTATGGNSRQRPACAFKKLRVEVLGGLLIILEIGAFG